MYEQNCNINILPFFDSGFIAVGILCSLSTKLIIFTVIDINGGTYIFKRKRRNFIKLVKTAQYFLGKQMATPRRSPRKHMPTPLRSPRKAYAHTP